MDKYSMTVLMKGLDDLNEIHIFDGLRRVHRIYFDHDQNPYRIYAEWLRGFKGGSV